MNSRVPVALLLILTSAVACLAQTPRRRAAGRTTATKSTAAQTPPAKADQIPPAAPPLSSTSAPPGTLAIVNDVTITSADIEQAVSARIMNDPDLYLRDFYQNREKAIREARQRAVDVRINSLLIAAAAKKAGLTNDQYLSRELTSKIATPTDAEVRAFYDANREQLGNVELESARGEILGYLRNQRMEQARADLVTRLKMTNTVMKSADVNAPNLAPGTVLASVNGQPLRLETINERMKAYIYKDDMAIYGAQKSALDRRINNLLITAEATKRQIGSEQILRTEVTDKLKPPTEAEVSKFYEENKARINGDLNSARSAIADYLQTQQQEKLEKDLADKLRAGARVQILLKEPLPPTFNFVAGRGMSRGDVNAPVKIIEFTDFQCSACGAMYPVLEEVLKSYGNRVFFEIRNFPLTSLHPNAFRAAQAAGAANAQGKFWPYIDFLFKNQSSLDDESLKKYASQVGLDRTRFDADLNSGKFDADILRDIEEGETYGIEGTPTIYINGVMLTSLGADGLREAIDRALARAGRGN
jgi:predicted DsbA family dithiol-disulfide isomerase